MSMAKEPKGFKLTPNYRLPSRTRSVATTAGGVYQTCDITAPGQWGAQLIPPNVWMHRRQPEHMGTNQPDLEHLGVGKGVGAVVGAGEGAGVGAGGAGTGTQSGKTTVSTSTSPRM